MPELGGFNQILFFLLVITPIVFIHELGHYWAARRAGVVVEVFSIGFGPELYAWVDSHGTRWRIAALPLGGYVKMRGDQNAASIASASARRIEGSFAGAGVFQRIGIVAAGPIANFLLGILLFAGIYMGAGKAFIPPVIGEVMEEGAAIEAGLKEGDKILAIDGVNIDDFNEMRAIIFENPNRELLFEIDRRGDNFTLPVTLKSAYSREYDLHYGVLGVRSSAAGEFRKLGVAEALYTATIDTVNLCAAMLRGIGRLVTGQASSGEIGGPVRIAELSADAAQQGLAAFIIFTALISINLGLINLFPIPALDGGHLVFFLIEAVIGKPLPDGVQDKLNRVGVSLLLSLMVVVISLDIVRKFTNWG
ncbi:MAG: RIP metalloprotease RseP [Candidatus Puniceispirillaceae bacterium]